MGRTQACYGHQSPDGNPTGAESGFCVRQPILLLSIRPSQATVPRELNRIAEMRGYPCMLVSENGTELTLNTILKWQKDRKDD